MRRTGGQCDQLGTGNNPLNREKTLSSPCGYLVFSPPVSLNHSTSGWWHTGRISDCIWFAHFRSVPHFSLSPDSLQYLRSHFLPIIHHFFVHLTGYFALLFIFLLHELSLLRRCPFLLSLPILLINNWGSALYTVGNWDEQKNPTHYYNASCVNRK